MINKIHSQGIWDWDILWLEGSFVFILIENWNRIKYLDLFTIGAFKIIPKIF